MASFTSACVKPASFFEVCDQLADFSRHDLSGGVVFQFAGTDFDRRDQKSRRALLLEGFTFVKRSRNPVARRGGHQNVTTYVRTPRDRSRLKSAARSPNDGAWRDRDAGLHAGRHPGERK